MPIDPYKIDFPTKPWGQHQLPSWLFYKPKTKDAFVSPAASFKPVAALDGEPRQGMTTPAQEERLKALVIDRTIFRDSLDETDVLAQIEWLKQQGIKVYLCV